MYHNINAGRLRDHVQFFETNNETDSFGQSIGDVFVFDARAEVKTVSGDKIVAYGTTTTSTIITIMMWYDVRAANDQVVVTDGVRYTVTHVKPDELKKSMIVTCEVIKK